jgi:hypothetical protein
MIMSSPPSPDTAPPIHELPRLADVSGGSLGEAREVEVVGEECSTHDALDEQQDLRTQLRLLQGSIELFLNKFAALLRAVDESNRAEATDLPTTAAPPMASAWQGPPTNLPPMVAPPTVSAWKGCLLEKPMTAAVPELAQQGRDGTMPPGNVPENMAAPTAAA